MTADAKNPTLDATGKSTMLAALVRGHIEAARRPE
jgi:hypothetical protein